MHVWRAADLGGLQADVPEAQQLSIWPEYNRVARRRLVWEAATALLACKPGGSLLLRIGDLLTSFPLGVLYVLFKNFRLFTILKPFSSCAASSEVFALFLDRAVEPATNALEENTDSTKYLFMVCTCTCCHVCLMVCVSSSPVPLSMQLACSLRDQRELVVVKYSL